MCVLIVILVLLGYELCVWPFLFGLSAYMCSGLFGLCGVCCVFLRAGGWSTEVFVCVRVILRDVACLFAHGNVYVVRVPGLLVVIFVSICVP